MSAGSSSSTFGCPRVWRFDEQVPEEFTRGLETRPMVAVVVAATDGSKVIRHLPAFPPDLLHLKRIRKVEDALQVLIGPGPGTEVPSVVLPYVRETLAAVEVPAHAPCTPEQVAAWGNCWPLTYRRPANLPVALTDAEVDRFERAMGLLEADARLGCVFLLPKTDRGGCGADVAGEQAASATVQAGHGEPEAKRRKTCSAVPDEARRQAATEDATNGAENGISADGTGTPDHARFPGFQAFASASGSASTSKSALQRHPLKSHAVIRMCDKIGASLGAPVERGKTEEQYLCVGAEVFLRDEPCVMCAMALVHSRVGTVVFAKPDPEFGGFGGCLSLHLEKKLNHHVRIIHAKRVRTKDDHSGHSATRASQRTAN